MLSFNQQQIAAIKRRLRDGEQVEVVARDFATTRKALRDHPDIGGYVDARGRHRIVFTEVDRKVAQGLAFAGRTNEQIALALDVSRDTIARHLAPDLVRWRADQVAIAGTGITRAAAQGSVPAQKTILQRAETGSWTDCARVAVEQAPSAEATTAAIEEAIGRMTIEERAALRVVTGAFQRIADEGSARNRHLAVAAIRR